MQFHKKGYVIEDSVWVVVFYGVHIFVWRPLTSHKLPPLGSICYLLVQSWMSSRHSIEHILKKIPTCQMMFSFWFWLSIVCHTEDKICCLVGMMLHLSFCSCRQMILSSRGLEKCKHVYKPFQVPKCIYLIGFLHDHGWLHIGNSWGELLADDHVEATLPVVTLKIKIGWWKVHTCPFGSKNWFWPSIFTKFSTKC